MGRSIPAGALATTLVLGLLTVPATPATADPGTAPREIAVIPESEATTPAHEALLFAGKTGFLHRHNNSLEYLWTRYDTGATVTVTDLAGLTPSAFRSAGGDSISILGQVPAKPAPDKVSVLDLSDQTWQQWARPTGYTIRAIYGQTMLVRKAVTGVQLEVFTYAVDGTFTTAPVTGLPAGATGAGDPVGGDLASVVLPYGIEGKAQYALLDLATARIVDIPGATIGGAVWRISGDTVGWAYESAGSGTFRLYSRTGLTSGTNTTARLVNAPYESVARSAVVGDGLIAARADAGTYGGSLHPAVSVPGDGGSHTNVLPMITWGKDALIQAPDGTALVVGGSGARDWAVHRISARPGEAPVTQPLLPVRDPVENAGLSYRQGLVRHMQTQVAYNGAIRYAMFSHPVFPDAEVTARRSLLPANTAPCAADARCVRVVDGHDSGARYLLAGTDGGPDRLRSAHNGGSHQEMLLPTTGGRIVDSSATYALVRDGRSTNQHVVEIGQSVARTSPTTGAALWFDTLWTATASAGQLTAIDLPTETSTRTVSTGAACVPTEVQTSARWIYWACGATGPAGVHDLSNNSNLAVPSGPVLLGDGFLVRHDVADASLRMTDFHDGTLHTPVKLANLPVGIPADGRDVTWAVDRHGSGVAYVDAENAVHVLDSGVPGTAPQVGSYWASQIVHPGSDDWRWRAHLRVSRPLPTWELTITRKWTGEVVHRQAGTNARQYVSGNWDGRLPSGKMAVNGPYQWTLTGTSTDNAAPAAVASSHFGVGCGTFPFRSYDCFGGSALLGVKSDGGSHWYGTRQDGTVPGRLYDNGRSETWCLSCTGAARTSALVPFGDYNGDNLPDLLVRDGNGGMKAHLGIGQLHFGASTTVSLGAGWMMYRSILAPGDVNGDGHHDILGIDADGKLWLYTTTGSGGINPRVQVGSGWTMYPRVIGAGDLNGDGHGDLLGIDSAGVMYRYFSNGNKGWSGRAQVSTGWSTYNSVVPIGDLNEDGRNDVVSRDANGVLWLHAGRGDGSFAAPVKAGSGWNMFKILI